MRFQHRDTEKGEYWHTEAQRVQGIYCYFSVFTVSSV